MQRFDEFDVERADLHRVLIIGQRETGKTTLARHIVDETSDGLIVDPMVFIQGQWQHREGVGRRALRILLDEYRGDTVHRLLERFNKNPRRSCYVVLDSCFFSDSQLSDENMRMLLMSDPTQSINVVVTLQYAERFPDQFCFDHVFAFKSMILSNKRRLYDCYFSRAFPTLESFVEALDTATSEVHAALVMETKTGRVYRYKAPVPRLHPLRVFGCFRSKM